MDLISCALSFKRYSTLGAAVVETGIDGVKCFQEVVELGAGVCDTSGPDEKRTSAVSATVVVIDRNFGAAGSVGYLDLGDPHAAAGRTLPDYRNLLVKAGRIVWGFRSIFCNKRPNTLIQVFSAGIFGTDIPKITSVGL